MTSFIIAANEIFQNGLLAIKGVDGFVKQPNLKNVNLLGS